MLLKGEFEGYITKSAQQLFSSTEGRIRENGLSLKERVRVDVRKNFLMVRVTQIGMCHFEK